MSSVPRSAGVVLAAGLGLLVASGCSGQNDGGGPSPSAATPVRVVVIGDSIPFGGQDCGACKTYVQLYGEWLEDDLGSPVESRNLSTHDGLTGVRLVERISTDDRFREDVAAADILIVSIGHNDTPWNGADDLCDGANGDDLNWDEYVEPCITESAELHAEQLAAILDEVTVLRDGVPTVQVVATDFNDWTGWSEGVPPEAVGPLRATIEAYWAATCRAADDVDGVCLDVYHAFNGADGAGAAGDLLSPDYIHPSAKGHQVIADLLAEVDVTVVTGR